MTREDLDLKELGSAKTKYHYDEPNIEILETFDNQHPDLEMLVDWRIPEFTSLCPKTGQPDFATIWISYIPDKLCVESKSMKLYMFSFRQHGEFHEDCVGKILKDVRDKISPRYLLVSGDFTPRGGISINPVAEYIKEGYTPPEFVYKALGGRLHTRHQ
jgi:7-cyano-7-deazaguanine reductase